MPRCVGVLTLVVHLVVSACAVSRSGPDALPPAEIAALLAFFDATGGKEWARRDWWQSPGHECEWHGVYCGTVHGHRTVIELSLAGNKLTGTVPSALAALPNLSLLRIEGNSVTGPLPLSLQQRIDSGGLRVFGYAAHLSRIAEIVLRTRATEMMCSDRELRVRADGAMREARERCSHENLLGPTHWEYRSGDARGLYLDRLFRLAETSGFERFRPEYPDHWSHPYLVTITINYRDGSSRVVQESNGAGPPAFWRLQQAIENRARSFPPDDAWERGTPSLDPDPDDGWGRFDGLISRLTPDSWSPSWSGVWSRENLPTGVREYLERRGCLIPQSPGSGFNNVVRGRFTASNQVDTAVLCSRGGISSILVFAGDSAVEVLELAPQPDATFMRPARSGFEFSRELGVAGPQYIRERHAAYGGPTPPPLEHDGINDIAVEQSSTVWYWYQGRWLRLQGAD